MCFKCKLALHALCLGGGTLSAVAFLDINWSELIRWNRNLKNRAFFSFLTLFSVCIYILAIGYHHCRLRTQ